MNEFGIPEKVKSEPELALLDAKLIQGSANPLFKLGLNYKQQQAVQNFTESAHRLSRKRIQLTTAAETWQPPKPVILPEEQQHALYDLQESYFQAVYNTLSKLAAVTVVFPETFAGVPVRSMEKFLKHFAKVPELAEACVELEKARVYRTQLDHPAGTPVSNWITARLDDDRGVVVYHFGKLGQSGKMPEGTEPPPRWFPIASDWYVDPPFPPYVDAALGSLMGHVFRSVGESFQARSAEADTGS